MLKLPDTDLALCTQGTHDVSKWMAMMALSANGRTHKAVGGTSQPV